MRPALRRRSPWALAAIAAGCGGGADEPDRLLVSAAASLTAPLTACSERFAGAPVRLSFAGSDELAAQIRQGARPDVFAAADTELPARLAREGRVGRPRVFASNRLVVAARRSSPLRRVEDLAAPGVVVATAAKSVPAGAYARRALDRLAPAVERRIVGNIRTAEPDVRGVVGKVAQGAADAGFVYASDVAAAEGRLRKVELPARLRPRVAYAAAVVRGAPNPRDARRFVDGLLRGSCARALRAAGFGPPPPA